MFPSNQITQADQLMKQGDQQQADLLLKQYLQNSPGDGDYADAVAIYLEGNMYDEAIAVFQLYNQATGKDLDSKSDFRLRDIQAEQLVHQNALQSSYPVQPIEETILLRPLSPGYDFFMLLFVALGIYPFLYVAFAYQQADIFVRIVFFLTGNYLFFTAIRLIITNIKADNLGVTILGAQMFFRRGQIRAHYFWMPKKRLIPYENIVKASVETIAAGRGVGVGIQFFLKDGSTDIVNFGPFLKKDCQKLVLKLRSKGVEVFVPFGILGKKFPS